MFEQAIRTKLRFNTAQGVLTSEDLYDLSLNNLYTIGNSVGKSLKDNDGNFFSDIESKTDPVEQLRFDIITAVIQFKRDALANQKQLAEDKAELQKILESIDTKKGENLTKKSIPELNRLAKKLKANIG